MSLVEKEVEQVFSVCEKCGFTCWFHVSFTKANGVHDVVDWKIQR